MHAARPGGRDSLRLTLPDIFPLCLGHIAQKLKHNIRNQRSGQIVPLPCVEQGHVEHHDIHAVKFRLAKLREYEYNPEIMRLTVMGGGACILKHFWDGSNKRVQ